MSGGGLAAFLVSVGAWGAASLTLAGQLRAERVLKKPSVRLWDTGKTYLQKNPTPDAMKDRAHCSQVPYGTRDYRPRGDLMLENDFFYLFLFTNKDDAVDLVAKLKTGGFKQNEIYKVHQDEHGLRNFGQGTMWTLIVRNSADEVTVMHAGEGRRHGKPEPIITTYRVRAGKPWLEVRPVQRVNQQGMHGKSRICAFVKEEGEDYILDSKRELFREEVNVPPPEGTIASSTSVEAMPSHGIVVEGKGNVLIANRCVGNRAGAFRIEDPEAILRDNMPSPREDN